MSIDLTVTIASYALGFFTSILLFHVSAMFRLLCRPQRRTWAGNINRPYHLPAVIAGGAADLDTLVRPHDHFPTDKVR